MEYTIIVLGIIIFSLVFYLFKKDNEQFKKSIESQMRFLNGQQKIWDEKLKKFNKNSKGDINE